MSQVRLSGVTKRFGGKDPVVAVDAMDLEIADGEFLVLLGPSGCGKTTTLRCLAGLENADEGRIALGDDVVFDSASGVNHTPDQRRLGMVFQSYALWPHMSVRKNIAYPLRARKLREGIQQGWVEDVAKAVDCEHLLDRYPGQLSGGQQQRIALARGLVARPDLVLFDEPLSNLDARLREKVRSELAELHGKLGFTAVYVTHDQSEALALGDRMVIMRSGRIEQLGTPQEVFRQPATEYVAAFIGMDNRLPLEPHAGAWTLAGQTLGGASGVGRTDLDELAVRLLPEDLHVEGNLAHPPADTDLTFQARIAVVAFGGRHLDLTLAVGDHRLQARVRVTSRTVSFAEGDIVTAYFTPRDVAVYHHDQRIADPATAFRATNPARRAVVG